MRYRRLGDTGALVSAVAMGTMNLGTVVDERGSHELMDHAFDAGITFFDNADVYGGPPLGPENGRSETLQGEWMRSKGNRDQLVVATKVQGRTGPGPNERGLSAVHIRQAAEDSLRRLQTDRIDLYQMHHFEREQPVDEVLEAFDILRSQGKIIYAGSSNFPGWTIAQYREVAAARRLPRVVTEQSVYSLANRAIESEVIPAAHHYGMGILAYAPLGGGLLGGILAKTEEGRSSGLRDRLGERRAVVAAHEELAASLEIPPAQLGLAWLLHQPHVTTPIIGPRTLAQLQDGIDAVSLILDDGVLGELDRLWPGPGAAPESYAW